MSFTLDNPFQYFNNPNNSNPVGLGRLYVGLPDTDPEQESNRVTVKAVQPNGSELAINQPVLLLAGGVPSYNGSPVQLKIELQSVSVKVTTANGAQVYYAARYSPAVSISSLADIQSPIVIAGIPATDLASEYRFQREFRADAYGLKESNNGLQNCQALQALSAAVKAAGGGKVTFPKGTYRVGSQIFAGATGKSYAYRGVPMFQLYDLPNGGVYLEFEGCKFELEDGLKFGAFDPVTGQPLNNTSPNFNSDTSAGTGLVFEIVNVRDVLFIGKLEIDGRDFARQIGGFFGDSGRQCIEYGIYVTHYVRLKIDGLIYCHNLLLDGLYTVGKVGDGCYTVVDGYIGLYNARQAWSCCGGSSIFAVDSIFGLTGYGVISSSPGSGLDLEPEGYPIKGFSAVNCWFPRSSGPSLVSDNFDVNGVKFSSCEFENTAFSSVWAVLKDIEFSNCTFRGALFNVMAGSNPNQLGTRPKFRGCTFLDRTRDGGFARRFAGTGGNGGILFNTVSADFENCRGSAELSDTYPVIGFMDGSNIDGFNLDLTGSIANFNGVESMFIRNSAYIKRLNINNRAQGTPAGDGVACITTTGTQTVVDCVITPFFATNSMVWDFPYLSSGARSGARRNQDAKNPQACVSLALWKQQSGGTTSIEALGAHRFLSYQSEPSDGAAFLRGDLAFNNSPNPSETPAWACTTGGVAGSTAVFKPYANVGA